MSQSQQNAHQNWSSSLLERVDQVVTRFEAALQAGHNPRIESCLENLTGPERAKLLFELVVVEVERLFGRGEKPQLLDYLRRFPGTEDQDPIRSAFGQVLGAWQPGRPQPGQLLFDRYEVLTHLGSGGMGAVWRVRERHSEKDYALKIEPVPDPDRLRRDYHLAEELRDDHIVTMRGLHVLDGHAYLCMDLVDGPDLGKWLEQSGPLPLDVALGIAEQLAGALDQMHRKGMVHRDLKPANVVLRKGREYRPGVPFVVLIDLGLLIPAEATVHGKSVTSLERAMCGTPAYMAPEQWMGQTITPAVDQWALAVIVYELLTGQLPFPGEAPGQICLKVCHQEPPRPAQLLAAQWTALSRALSKDRHGRYRSCTDLVASLRGPDAVSATEAAPAPPAAAPAAMAPLMAGQVVVQNVVMPVVTPPPGYSFQAAHALLPVFRSPAGWAAGGVLGVLCLYLLIAWVRPKGPVELYQQACTSGDAHACNELGDRYANGRDVTRSDEKAFECYKRACDGGLAAACFSLGTLYEAGRGEKQDLTRARTLYERVCGEGYVAGCSRAGWDYYTGQGVEKDKGVGLAFLQKGCKGGDKWGCDKIETIPKKDRSSGSGANIHFHIPGLF